MDVPARVSSKGQITLPKSVRDALDLKEGDAVVFRVDGDRALLARTPDLLSLAGTFNVPASKRGVPWAEVIEDRPTGSSGAGPRDDDAAGGVR